MGMVGYTASYFCYKTPRAINGTPTYSTLRWLHGEVWVSASNVEYKKGDWRYLGLVLRDAEHHRLSDPPPPPFIPPEYPEEPKIPNNTSQVMAFAMKEKFEEKSAYNTNVKMSNEHSIDTFRKSSSPNILNLLSTLTQDCCRRSSQMFLNFCSTDMGK